MKKCMLTVTVMYLFLILAGSCLAYSVSGTVYDRSTMEVVSDAQVTLRKSSSASSTSTTTDTYGSFTLGWSGQNLIGDTMTLSAAKGSKRGLVIWKATTNAEHKDVSISPMIIGGSHVMVLPQPANHVGDPGTTLVVPNPVMLQAPGVAGLQVQNAQIILGFNGAGAIGPVANVTSAAGDVTIDSWSQPVIPGPLEVKVIVDPPRPIIEFPAESFFDVYFEVELPETDSVLGTITVEEALFNDDGGGLFEFAAPASLTQLLIGEHEDPSPYFLVDSEDEWNDVNDADWPELHIRGLNSAEGENYLLQLKDDFIEGEPYSPIEPDLPEFIPPGLFIYPGGDDGQSSPVPDPEDAGLVMTWGDDQTPDGEKASAWAWDYGDPDLSNCIITVTAIPPGPSGINRISLGMQDINGNIRSWWWNVPAVIPYNVPTTVTIDTTQIGLAAANPPASGFANNAAFDVTKVQNILADENATWVSGAGAPAPGGGVAKIWNYWNNLSVTPKLPGGGANSKWYVKWSQPPVEISDGLIDGWDEVSMTQRLPNDPNTPIMADDWQCDSDRPVTDIHWWGSFIGWTQPHLPPILPSAFHIGIWTDQPDPNPNPTPGIHNDDDWSHPLTLVWENTCTTSVWNFAGYDVDPREGDPDQQENEACFQWAQFLSQDEWFHQEEGTNVYWVSIAAIYPANTDFTSTDFYPWGWKTRPHFFMDDAVRILRTTDGTWPPVLGSTLAMNDCDPIHIGEASWDMAFELTTNEPAYEDDPLPGDIAGAGDDGLEPDGTVDLADLAIVARNWLTVATP